MVHIFDIKMPRRQLFHEFLLLFQALKKMREKYPLFFFRGFCVKNIETNNINFYSSNMENGIDTVINPFILYPVQKSCIRNEE